MSGSGWETLPDIREWSNGPPGCTGVIGSPTQMSASVREALRDVREWSGGPFRCPGSPPRCLGVVGRISRLSGVGGRPFRMSGRPSWISKSGQFTLPYVREWSGGPL